MFDKVPVRYTFDDMRTPWDAQGFVEQHLACCFVSGDVASNSWDFLYGITNLPYDAFLQQLFLYNPLLRVFWIAYRSVG